MSKLDELVIEWTDDDGTHHQVEPSASVRAGLAGQTCLLAFSRGKDALAAWLAMREAGINVLPFYRYQIPRLRFVRESLDYFEQFFQTKILTIPHPSFFRQLDTYMFTPPQRCRIIDFAGINAMDYRESNDMVIEEFQRRHPELGVSKDTWICDGVRASDTPARRRALKMYGPRNEKERHVHIVWDWTLPRVWHEIDSAGIKRPLDYAYFKRSLDGLDYRYLAPLREHYPDDYERILKWYPLLEVEMIRRERLSRRHPELKVWTGVK